MNFLVLIGCLVAAAIMGYAIQRGATCTVAAVDEVVTQRSFNRLTAMAEAALWVLGGLLAWRTLHGLSAMPRGYPVGLTTLAGGALLGLGAFVNRACVFGAIARLGSGEWAYGFTPLGYYLGCLSLGTFGVVAAAPPLPGASPVLSAPVEWGWVLVAMLVWRLGQIWRLAGRDALSRRIWSPHVATCVIGVAFVVLLLAAGSWAYTDVLAELSRGMAAMVGNRLALAIALLAGAILGGWTAGRLTRPHIDPVAALRCMSGGMLMGWGSLLIPGGNDGLILLGMPLLWPYAWTAFAVMCLTIAVALLAQRRFAHR